MRCDTHCPPDAGFPVGRALAVLAVAAAVSLVTAFLAAVSGVVYAVLAAVWGVLVPAVAVFVWRKLRASQVVNLYHPAPPTILQNKNPAAITAAQRRALPAARPVLEGVVVNPLTVVSPPVRVVIPPREGARR